MTANPNILFSHGFPCYLLPVWGLALCTLVWQSLCNTTVRRYLPISMPLPEQKTPSYLPFFIGAFTLGPFMASSAYPCLILPIVINYRFLYEVVSTHCLKTAYMALGAMLLMFSHSVVRYLASPQP